MKMETQETRSVVFFVDDEPSVCKAVGQSLAELPCQFRPFHRGEECLKAVRAGHPECDLLITDLSMPDMDGLELLKAVRKIRPHLPVLVVTGYGDIPVAVKAMKAGAVDFIEKPLDEGTFVPLVRSLLDRSQAESSKRPPLTEAERKILNLIVDGKGNKEMAYLLHCSIRTVENHRYRMMRKLNVDGTASLVKIAITQGLVATEPVSP